MKKTHQRILIIENQPKWQKNILKCNILKRIQEQDKSAVVIIDDFPDAEKHLNQSSFDLAITDVRPEDEEEGEYPWRGFARLLQERQIPIIVVSGFLTPDLVIEMVNKYGVIGIYDKKTLDTQELDIHIRKIIAKPDTMIGVDQKTNTITWLHISDLHFGFPDPHDRTIVTDALMRDLNRCKERGLKPDFIIVTGDITYKGKPEGYALAKDFFDKLIHQTKVPKEHLLLVPGNHDVNREQIPTLARNELKNRKTVTGVWADNNSRSLYMKRLEGYIAFVHNYFGPALDYDPCAYSKILPIRNHRIAILGLNSVWTSGNVDLNDEIRDKGNLVVGEKQVTDVFPGILDSHVRIAAMHHPLSYLQDFDIKDIDLLLSRNCHFLLHGHLQEPEIERKATLKGELIVIPAGAVYQGRDLVNSYNYVFLDFDNKQVRVIFRRYSDVQKEWLKDLDATGEERDGELLFDMTEEFSKKDKLFS